MRARKPAAAVFFFFLIFFFSVVFFVIDHDMNSSVSSNPGNQSAGTAAEPVSSAPAEYRVPFGKDFSRGLAAVDDLGLSILIAVDCSGSMSRKPESGGEPKFVQASKSLNEILAFLEEFMATRAKGDATVLKVGIVKFSTSVKELFKITEMTPLAFGELKALTADPSNFRPGGDTAIGMTLEKGTELLAQSGTIFKSLIIISDGENTEGIDPAPVLEAVLANRNTASDADYTVYTNNILVTFIGFDVDSGLFTELNSMGARVTNAQSAKALKESLKSVFLADITKLEAKQ